MTIVTRDDITRYIHDTLPWDELSDWDIDAIADDMTAAWPLIGQHRPPAIDPSVTDDELWLIDCSMQPDKIIDRLIDGDRYWQMVQDHQTG
ncbi:hypothetical protein JDV09_15395 [Mycobacterium sp. Y57]|uniref:hypothetical protein n=1 Tax=Mycolicibacterium xanthum TaxID=2796469 RepID=UPI001C84DD88|nr:hypothetical protein [Mycolicibacterium xanthum]MBX7433485.1 hypothetical protein [Mycolicibacterium xanthum]